jgi:hypothetical protein
MDQPTIPDPSNPDGHPEVPPPGRLLYEGDSLTARAWTARTWTTEQLTQRLNPDAAAVPTELLDGAAGWSAGQPGASARAEYRRRRALELAHWWRGAPWRLAVVIGGGFAGYALASALLLPHPGWLLVLGAAAGAYLVRFHLSQPTRAWRDGARGERATARRLRCLKRDGYTILHDVAVPGSRANIDHLVIGPGGVFVVDSKRYRGHVSQSPDGMVWHGRHALAQTLATVWWEAGQVAEALRTGPQVPVTPVLVIHRARVAWGGLWCAGVAVVPPNVLLEALRADPALPTEVVRRLADDAATTQLRPAA